MRSKRSLWMIGGAFFLSANLFAVGCYHTPVDMSEYAQGPAPLRTPSPSKELDNCSYEDSLTGGQVFTMYCSYCHNAPTLAERPFSSFQNVALHMRDRANLTGKEYAKLVEFMKRWNDIPPAHGPVEPSPKKFVFSQPIQELKEKTPAKSTADALQLDQKPEVPTSTQASAIIRQ
jgi:hypothetical protein